ncbi:tail fiber assembly protein, partial [Escherichia coli]|nr:tail fiber assembly protein [Escherichia coli]
YTTVAPSGPYQKWDGKKWVTDTDAQHVADVEAAEQKKAALLAEAQEKISLWQTELRLDIISDGDKESLIAWVQYIKAIQAIDTSSAPNINWPTEPE